MMNMDGNVHKRLSPLRKAALTFFILFCACLCICAFGGGRYTLNASAASDVMSIDRYDIQMEIQSDRKIKVKERIQMTANTRGRVFTRSLPLEGDRYYDITAACVSADAGEKQDFSYAVVDNEMDFLDIECRLLTPAGVSRVYEISYVMEIGRDDVKNGMLLDVVGYGWGVPLHNVCVKVKFPTPISEKGYTVYSGGYGAAGNDADVQANLSDDGKTLTLTADTLRRVYNDTYEEYMAEGIALSFVLEAGALENFFKTQLFTDDMWWILLLGLGMFACAVGILVLTRKKRDVVTVVNIKAPDQMDPLQMGKLLDGRVDTEDVTSMIYYFADKGYLSIDFSIEEDPVLIRRGTPTQEQAAPYARTLFEGLFRTGSRVHVSSLKEEFYTVADRAILQAPKEKMFDNKSLLGFWMGGVLGVFYAFIVPFLMCRLHIGGGYSYALGAVFAVPVFGILLIEYCRECYRYKWKAKKHRLIAAITWLIAVLACLLFSVLFARHILTPYEKAVMGIFACLCAFTTSRALSRTQRYCDRLGQILGFKDFIVVTEEDKIKFMLEENPELYYKILPYAQVLGVTDEWEKKFENILQRPPAWGEKVDTSTFNYAILNIHMRHAAKVMLTRPQPKGNGSFVGRSGGGGSFGGFGGGGHGGGGGGWR